MSHPLVEKLGDAFAEMLSEDGVVLYPTETVYGLGCHPDSDVAIDKIRAIKGRDDNKPMIIVTDSWERVDKYIGAISTIHRKLMDLAENHVLTILFTAEDAVSKKLIGHSSKIGIRLTKHEILCALIQAGGTALVSTSANKSGQYAQVHRDMLDSDITSAVDAIFLSDKNHSGRPSTLVDINNGEISVLREGELEAEMLLSLSTQTE